MIWWFFGNLKYTWYVFVHTDGIPFNMSNVFFAIAPFKKKQKNLSDAFFMCPIAELLCKYHKIKSVLTPFAPVNLPF